MKRSTTLVLAALAATAALWGAPALAAAHTTRTVTMTAQATSQSSFALTVTVTDLGKLRKAVLHDQIVVENAAGQQVGPTLPWTNDGSRPLSLRYADRGYWAGSASLVLAFSPPLLPTDQIVVRWVASYGKGKARINSAPVSVTVPAS